MSPMMAGVAPKMRKAPRAYPRDLYAGEPDCTAGSTLVMMMETVLSLLRRMSKVRNCCGWSRSEQVSTSQKAERWIAVRIGLRGYHVHMPVSRHPQDEIGILVQHIEHVIVGIFRARPHRIRGCVGEGALRQDRAHAPR